MPTSRSHRPPLSSSMASAARRASGRRRWRASLRPASRRWRWTCRDTAGALRSQRWTSRGWPPTSKPRSIERGLNRPILVGHSMGGMVAQTALAAAAGRLQLPPCWPAPARPSAAPTAHSRRSSSPTGSGPLDAGKTMADLAPRMVDRMIGPAADPAGRAHAVEVMSAVPADTYRAAVRCLVGFDERANLPKIARSRALPRRREGSQRSGGGRWSAWPARFPAPATSACPASDTCRTWRRRPPSMLLFWISCARCSAQ